MSFWDSSALVPLIVEEASSPVLKDLYRKQTTVHVWWSTEVECVSAFARLGRMGELATSEVDEAVERLAQLVKGWQVVRPLVVIRNTATLLLRRYGLRAADSLQLAAAHRLAGTLSKPLQFVTLDERLEKAAKAEGLSVIGGVAV